MGGTFTSELATRRGPWVFAAEIAGWGRRINATSSLYQSVYRLSTEHPYRLGWGANSCDSYLACLLGPIHTVGEDIDLRSGATRLGTLSLSLADRGWWDFSGSVADHGWGDHPVIGLLASQAGAHSTHATADGRWTLASAMSSSQVTCTLSSATGISVGDALWLESEALVVTSIAGAPTLGVSRGMYSTTAAAHEVLGASSEGVLYDRPQFLRGRGVKVYAYLIDRTTGELLVGSEYRRLIWRGTVDDWSWSSGGPIVLACKPAIGKLDRALGRNSVQAQWDPQAAGDLAARRESPVVAVDLPPDGSGEPRSWDYPLSGSDVPFLARWGDELVAAQSTVATPETVEITARGLLGSSLEHAEVRSGSGKEPFRDVLVTTPSPLALFVDTDGSPTTHPIDVILSLITSTGDGTNGDWDCLPSNWGAAFPVADINLETFRSLKLQSSGVSFDRLTMGWDGKPTPLRAWLTSQILGPMGWFLYDGVGASGDRGLCIGTISDLYPGETATALDEGDIIDGTWSLRGQLPATLSTQTFRFDLDLSSGVYQQVRIIRRPEVLVRYPDDDAEISYDVPGVGHDSVAGAIMEGRALNFASWFATPLPLVEFIVRLSLLDLAVTEKVSLTLPDAPNPLTGGRGLSGVTAIVLSAHPDFEGGETAGVRVVSMLVPDRNVGLWSPSGVVRSYDSATLTITLEEDAFTNGVEAGQVPERDVLGFSVDDAIILLTEQGAQASTDTAEIMTIEGAAGNNTLVIDSAFAGATPAPGMIITYAHYSGGASPTSPWLANMKQTVAQADDADDLLPNGDDAYVYGA